MPIAKRYDYNLFVNSENWTVDTLNARLSITNEKRIPIIDLVKINETTIKKMKLKDNTILPYIEVKNVNSEKKVLDVQGLSEMSIEDLPTRAKYAGRPGDIIISSIRPELGSIAILPGDYELYAVSSNFFVLTSIDIPSELLYFLLSDQSVLNEFGALAGGSVIPTLTLKDLKDYQIKDFDNSLEIANRAVDLYKKLKFNTENLMSISEAADNVFTEELLIANEINKELPKFKSLDYTLLKDRFDVEYLMSLDTQSIEWKVSSFKIGEIASVENAPCKSNSNEYFGEEIPLVQTKDLQENIIYLNSKDVKTVKVNTEEASNDNFLNEADIVITKMGGKLSKSAIVPTELIGAISNPNSYVIRNLNENILTEYLMLFFKTTIAQNKIEEQMRSGLTMKMLKLSMLKALEIPVPSIEVQKTIIDEIDKLSNCSNKSTLEEEVNSFRKELFK